MLSKIFIGFFSILLFGMSSAHTYADGYLNTRVNQVEKIQADADAEEGENEEVRVSMSYEAVFQVFSFFPKTWSTNILAFTQIEVYQDTPIEFLIRDFLVTRSSTLFRMIISRNAP